MSLQPALHALRSGDDAGAYALLFDRTRAEPANAEAWRLLGVAARRLARDDEAETAFQAAIRAGKKDPANHAEYAAFLHTAGRLREAERAYRAALALDRRHAFAAAGLADLLLGEKRLSEALQVTTPALAADTAPAGLRHVHANALRELNRFAEAEALLEAVVAERPQDDRAQSDLAELVWMRTADAREALRRIDEARAARPDHLGLIIAKARVLNQAGEGDAARAFLDEQLARSPGNTTLLAARGRLGGEGQRPLLESAWAARPGDPALAAMLAQARLETGDPAGASALTQQLLAANPLDQYALALQATAWRLLGDPRYGELYDYDRTVFVGELAAPRGWPDLRAYLADLAHGLHALHVNRTHPFGQSVKGGSQVTLQGARHAAIAAIDKALAPPIGEAIERLRAGGHPLGARATGRWRHNGMWSIKLFAGGWHDNHIHNDGWLSSACYVELPPLPRPEGWLKLGQPGLKLPEPLEPDRWVEPKEGQLVLFPSYMWHGVAPFSSDRPRLTVAFDLVPA